MAEIDNFIDLLTFTEKVGERIESWIEKDMTFENGMKRLPEEGEEEFSWAFTQKGQRLYESYLSKAQRIIEKKYPNQNYEDLENYTGVIYP
ncbi:hypothetical protein Phi4:1_gp001 [Cellulophaga phage phi4:1]|uniref:Uncharacterized protein n=5 Tax=Lightbulbvirus TaxID=1918522 RepID=A0A0S2MWB2_9CAUD|nr:hypothetical protein Phi4:1_gp001 [Cellulophaga phage phi4:1]YP_008241496.1 hypothetical protein Phi17:2_gp001 [Cellulophaga phage phi17:2]ALO80010.1 hypothetical protein Phi4113_001 [Cellulophaga phage phi4:1_13]ALO80207.1 hypothetical protein Phi4118_001 [Cellulophaga phage phi4:1_18]ALO80404.1 hypothetical protein Phi17218_001 [Cellulophaga phage phi17:2_18]AGO47534.1 hypothetical protein Phi17:2_gp001 [Cellulophaga phage phi17:2]AGO49414.1 hypothetical protein Phi4:1_gp001 [Cellulophag